MFYQEVLNYLKKNRRYAFTHKNLAENLNVDIRKIYDAIRYIEDQVKKVRVEGKLYITIKDYAKKQNLVKIHETENS